MAFHGKFGILFMIWIHVPGSPTRSEGDQKAISWQWTLGRWSPSELEGKISRKPASWGEENCFQLNPLMISDIIFNHIQSTSDIIRCHEFDPLKKMQWWVSLWVPKKKCCSLKGRCDSRQTQWSRTGNSLDHDLHNKSRIVTRIGSSDFLMKKTWFLWWLMVVNGG